jgi:hypothetical protein
MQVPPRDQLGPDIPLRLEVAAAVAYPDGSMKASGLRREAARGRLVIERVAGKDYTTLANIERMRELCRVQTKEPGYGCALPAARAAESLRGPSGLSVTATGISPRDALRIRLAKRKST